MHYLSTRNVLQLKASTDHSPAFLYEKSGDAILIEGGKRREGKREREGEGGKEREGRRGRKGEGGEERGREGWRVRERRYREK